MKKFVNVRLPVILVLALIAGVLLGYLFIRIHINIFYIILVIPAAAIIYISCILYKRKKLLLYCMISIIFLTLGTLGSYLRLDSYSSKELTDGDTYLINATVSEKGLYDGGEYVIVKNVYADGQKINGKIKVYLSSSYGEFCDVGYEVSFKAPITTFDTFPYGKLNYNALKNIKYRCYINGGITSTYGFSFFGSINKTLRKTVYNNLDPNTAAIAYAMLTGNTDGVEDGSMTAFRYGGIAHIFAVSGLHIGIIYGILSFLCKKLRINRYIAFTICVLPLFFYTGICGFTVSSVRAFVMCTVTAVARILFSKYDALNSLSLSVTTILLINPLNLFNTGFQLSVAAVCSIILIAKNIMRPLKKLPKKLKGAIGVSLSAQAGTLPVMLTKFGYLSGAGILLNILIVPILSAIYAVVFTATVISVILPFLSRFILPYAVIPLEFTVSFITDIGFEKSIISGFGAGAFAFIYYIGLFALSDKLNLKLRYRITCMICAIALLCTYIPLKTFAPFNSHKVIASANYGGGEILFKSSDGNILVITENINLSRLDLFLNEYYASDLDTVIILGGENSIEVLENIDFNCNVYLYEKYINIQPFKNKKIIYEKRFTLNGISFEFFDGYSLLAEYEGLSIGICGGKYIPFDSCDYLFADNIGKCAANTVVSFNERNLDNCIYDNGDFVIRLKNN